jgi:putative intracellular protease/amidase
VNTDHTLSPAEGLPKSPCALLWDESLLWGLMAWRALREAGLPFDLLRSEDIRAGGLNRYRMIFVPGGWASNKTEVLGMKGMEEIRRFVAEGGSYLGICGGAGMATENGLDLLPVKRKPASQRVPSFSGPIHLSCVRHAIWKEIQTPVFSLWWPSQFQVGDRKIRVLARYEEAQADAFSADINVADGEMIGWAELEKNYGILLNPERLSGEPAVLEGRFGCGRVILSLVHFDTPGDLNGAAVLRNLWRYLTGSAACRSRLASGDKGCSKKQNATLPGSPAMREGGSDSRRLSDPPIEAGGGRGLPSPDVPEEVLRSVEEILAAAEDLIAFGIRNFLWRWRNPMILQWRRGVRGLEYSTLAVMAGEIRRGLHTVGAGNDGRSALPGAVDPSRWKEDVREIREQLIPFCEQAKRLLVRERFYMMNAPLSPMECADAEISRMRQDLFGSAMSHGGRFKRLIDHVDRLLYRLIKEE